MLSASRPQLVAREESGIFTILIPLNSQTGMLAIYRKSRKGIY